MIAPREGKPPRRPSFFICCGCSVMFRDREQFTLGKRARLHAAPMETWGTVEELPAAGSVDKEGSDG